MPGTPLIRSCFVWQRNIAQTPAADELTAGGGQTSPLLAPSTAPVMSPTSTMSLESSHEVQRSPSSSSSKSRPPPTKPKTNAVLSLRIKPQSLHPALPEDMVTDRNGNGKQT